MSELEELPSWAGRSTSEVAEADLSPAGDAATPPTPSDDTPSSDTPSGDTPTMAEPPAASPADDDTDQVTTPADAVAPTAAIPAASALATEPSPPIVAGAPISGRGMSGGLKVLLGLLGIAALLGVGALGYLLADSRNSSETEATGEVAPTSDGLTDPTDAAGADDDTAAGTATDGADDETGGASDDDTVTLAVDPEADDTAGDSGDGTATDSANGSTTDMNVGNRQAFFRGGKVYLTGAVPSEEIGQLIVDKAAAVVGPENVVNEYTIDPTVAIAPGESAPLYVEDVVLFEFNSIAVAEPFLPLLDLGALLLRQNPQASMTVVTRTDAVGSEEVNLQVATERGEAVLAYWTKNGVDPAQVSIDARGEEGASEDDDAATAAQQRRAEFIITGLLD